MSCNLLRGDCLGFPPPIPVALGAYNYLMLFLKVGFCALVGTGLSTGEAYFMPAIPDLR